MEKKVLVFFPDKEKNIRYPHIGVVIIEDNVEIGCGSTIDSGSLSNTIIGKNTFLDNQIHIAHNVKIGENSIIAAGAVLTSKTIVEPGSIYAGVPAKKIKDVGQKLVEGEINRIANNYVRYAGWYK